MPPPGLMQAPIRSTLSGERITAGHDLESQNGQRRYLCGELGITQREARVLIKAYAADLADALRIGNDTARSDAGFLGWLMRQAPGPGRQRGVLKRGWRVAS